MFFYFHTIRTASLLALFLLNKKKQKSQAALLLHLPEIPVSFYVPFKFFILLQSSHQI